MMRLIPSRFRRRPAPSPRSDGTAELEQALEQRDIVDDLVTKNRQVGADLVARIEANHTAEALAAWYSRPEPSRRLQIPTPWRHA